MRRQIFGSTVVKLVSTISSYAVQYALILSMSQDAYGRFSLMMSVASIAAMGVALGHPQILLRAVASQIASGMSHGLKEIWCTSHIWVVAVSSLLFVGITVFGAISENDELVRQLGWVVAILPVWAMLKLNSSLLYGVNLTTIAQFSETAIRPFCFFCFVLVIGLFEDSLTTALALFLNLLAFIFAFAHVVIVNVRQKSFQLLQLDHKATNQSSGWFSASLIFALTSAMQLLILNVDILMIGWLLGDASVALYRVAVILALAIASVEEVVGLVIRPIAAAAYSAGRIPEMLIRIRKLALYAAFFCGVGFSLFWLFGEDFITYVFGKKYAPAYMPTLILFAGATISALVGPIGLILNMTKNERAHFVVTVASLLLNIFLNVVLIPLYGITGAAIASFVTILAYRLTAVALFTRLTGHAFLQRGTRA